jgi:hypothetical protein
MVNLLEDLVDIGRVCLLLHLLSLLLLTISGRCCCLGVFFALFGSDSDVGFQILRNNIILLLYLQLHMKYRHLLSIIFPSQQASYSNYQYASLSSPFSSPVLSAVASVSSAFSIAKPGCFLIIQTFT